MIRSGKMGIIGCGNMGVAISKAVVEAGVFPPEDLLFTDKDMKKSSCLAEACGGEALGLKELADAVDIAVIAVKPQDLPSIAEELKSSSLRRYISIMAGKTIADIRSFLGADIEVARVMPNIGAKVRESVSAISFSDNFSERGLVDNIFFCIGRAINIPEALMDAATAVSGSGPAYLLYFAVCMARSARDVGFTDEVAKEMVTGTFSGVAEILKTTDKDYKDLIAEITSKGGTTQAALEILFSSDFNEVVDKAIGAALSRSKELSGGD